METAFIILLSIAFGYLLGIVSNLPKRGQKHG